MNIRRARAEDAKRVTIIHRTVAAAEYHAPDLVAALVDVPLEVAIASWQDTLVNPGAVVYVATADRHMIGFAAALTTPRPIPVPIEPERPGALLDHVYVSDGYRNSGVGRRLVERIAKDLLRVHSVTAMHAWTYAENQAGQSFCEHLGGIRFDLPPLDMVLFVWEDTATLSQE